MFTIGFGVGNVQTRDENLYNNISQVLNDSSLQAALSFDPNQVDARVNGVVIDPGDTVTGGVRIELVKKAGRKSAGQNEPLTTDNQLQPIGMAHETRVVLAQHADQTMAPYYAALNKSEAGTAKAVKGMQRELLADCDPFKKYQNALIDRLVETSFVDSVGGLQIPSDVREALDKIATEADKELEAERKALRAVERTVQAWTRSVTADISMSVTIADQRVLVAKALASNPTEPWVMAA